MTVLEITLRDPSYTSPDATITFSISISQVMLVHHSKNPATGKYNLILPTEKVVILTEREYEAIKYAMTSVEVKGKVLKIPLED